MAEKHEPSNRSRNRQRDGRLKNAVRTIARPLLKTCGCVRPSRSPNESEVPLDMRNTPEPQLQTTNIVEESHVHPANTVEVSHLQSVDTTEESYLQPADTVQDTVEESRLQSASTVEESHLQSANTTEEPCLQPADTTEEPRLQSVDTIEESYLQPADTVQDPPDTVEESHLQSANTTEEPRLQSVDIVEESHLQPANSVEDVKSHSEPVPDSPPETDRQFLLKPEDKEKIDKVISDAEFIKKDERNGVIFVIAMRAVDTVASVVAKVEETFGKEGLNYAVCGPVDDPSVELLSALMSEASNYTYPKSCSDKLVVYCIAPIGNHNGSKYIVCDDNRRYYIRDIVSHFAMPKDRQQFFFFDGYLVPEEASPDAGSKLVTSVDIESLEGKDSSLLPAHLPKQGDILVAFSPLASVYKDQSEMCKWSHTLCDNIKNYILPVSTLLEKTWDEEGSLVGSHEPHYISSMGVAFLHGGEEDVTLEEKNTQRQWPQETPTPKPPQRPSTPPLSDVDLENIKKLSPDKIDLEAAILPHLNNSEERVWKDRFGTRILEKLSSKSKSKLSTTTQAQFLINLLYDKDNKPIEGLTWENVLIALEEPTQLKSDNRELIADKVREYMTEHYRKYSQRLNI